MKISLSILKSKRALRQPVAAIRRSAAKFTTNSSRLHIPLIPFQQRDTINLYSNRLTARKLLFIYGVGFAALLGVGVLLGLLAVIY